ncbi:MAG: MarR family winged helix-turn-helix transcriptional regulator [Propionibacteriaceae bacterium]
MPEPQLPSELDRLSVDLVVAAARFTRAAAHSSGATEAQAVWRALSILDEHGPVRVSDFALIDRCSQPTATTMLQRLEQSGAVQRVPDPRDGRATLLSLSEQGSARLHALRTDVADGLRERMSNLSPGQREQVRTAVEVLDALVRD